MLYITVGNREWGGAHVIMLPPWWMSDQIKILFKEETGP